MRPNEGHRAIFHDLSIFHAKIYLRLVTDLTMAVVRYFDPQQRESDYSCGPTNYVLLNFTTCFMWYIIFIDYRHYVGHVKPFISKSFNLVNFFYKNNAV